MSSALRTSFFLIVFKLVCCWRVSRDTFKGSVSESTMPLMKLKYLGNSSSNSSEMKTRRTYNLSALARL